MPRLIERTDIIKFLAIMAAVAFVGVACYLLYASQISGAEFVALLTLGVLTSVIINSGGRIESITIAGHALKLKRENERAEANIEQLNELASAIADSLTISLPGLYDDPSEKAYREGLDLINRYKLFHQLQPQKHFPHEKLELAVRNYLYETNIGIKYRAMYDDVPEIPSPSQLLSEFNGNQRIKLSRQKFFRLYEVEIYPIYVESKTRELRSEGSQ